jgi:hypothetical protein
MRSLPMALFKNTPGAKSFETAKEATAAPSSEDGEWRLEKLGPILVAWLVLYAIAIVGSLSESPVAITAKLQTGLDPILIASAP